MLERRPSMPRRSPCRLSACRRSASAKSATEIGPSTLMRGCRLRSIPDRPACTASGEAPESGRSPPEVTDRAGSGIGLCWNNCLAAHETNAVGPLLSLREKGSLFRSKDSDNLNNSRNGPFAMKSHRRNARPRFAGGPQARQLWLCQDLMPSNGLSDVVAGNAATVGEVA